MLPTLDCAHVIRRLPDYVEGDASAARCAEIEQHLESCAKCRLLLVTLRQANRQQFAAVQPAALDRPYRSTGLSSRF
jgi:predicted anti-sigma-YlaC factor YlaD